MTSQKYCIEWDKFESSLSRNYSQIRQDVNNFSDVTLVSDDEDSFPAHKFVLAGSSTFFQNILKKNPHPVPLLYLSGVSSQYLKHALDFIYEGKVEIDQQNLTQFLSVGEKLKISGLLRKSEDSQRSNESILDSEIRQDDDKLLEELYSTDSVEKQTSGEKASVNENENLQPICAESIDYGQMKVVPPSSDEVLTEQLLAPKEEKRTPLKATRAPPKLTQNGEIQHVKKTYCYEKITITDVDQIKPKIEELSEKVGGIWRCKFCGKTTASQKKNELSTHIESHFEGVNYHCTICNRTCKTRTALRGHMYREHKAVPDPTLQPTITPVNTQYSSEFSQYSTQYMNF